MRALATGAETEINIAVLLPDDVVVGDYEVKVDAESFTENRSVTTDPKTLRFRVRASTNLFSLGIVSSLLIALIVAVVYFGFKLSRR